MTVYERSYGYRYKEAGDGYQTAASIAKLIRQDIKQARAEGLIDQAVKIRVRSESYTGGQSIDVDVEWAEAWQDCDGGVGCHDVWCSARTDDRYAKEHRHAHQVLTEEAEALKMTLQRIHGAYNHDGSEIQTDYFDVRYYGGVSFSNADTIAWRAEEKAKAAARKAATDAGTVVGKVVNWRSEAKAVHLLVEAEGKKRLACGARTWFGNVMSKVADDSTVTCSRCAKRQGRMS